MPGSTPLHVEILLHPPAASPTILPSPELTLLHTTIETIINSLPSVTTTSLPLPPSLRSLTLPTSASPVSIAAITTTLCDDDPSKTLASWLVTPVLHLYAHSAGAPTAPPGAVVTPLPSATLHPWDTLHFPHPLKSVTLSYILSRREYGFLPSSGFLLLHGAPGTGKSSLAEALAQKVAIRVGQGCLVRLTHESLSKYFGESANRVGGVFRWALQQSGVVVVVIDEIESFGMRRSDADGAGDGVRVTNALLTGLDAVRRHKNVTVIGTSNRLDGVDAAVRDRADVCLEVCEMGAVGRGAVLRRVLRGLVERGVLEETGDLGGVVRLCEGLSGRRVEGCVIVALGLVAARAGGSVAWEVFEKALRRAVTIATDVRHVQVA